MGETVANSIKERLIKLLLENKGTYLSGQKLSDKLACSRTAIWKHINELKKEGYQLNSVQNRGYQLLSRPNNIRPHDLRPHLETDFIGQSIVYHEVVTSTQELAHSLANEGAEEGTIVIAEHQSKGRGRLGRDWESPQKDGLWFSLLLRPKIPPLHAPQLTLLTAVAVVEGIKNDLGVVCEIKWPNDVLMNGKKICGILTELQAEADQIRALIIGVGINVNMTEFPDYLRSKATSLFKELNGKEVMRAKLLQSILKQFEDLYTDYLNTGFEPIKQRWESYAISLNRQITARTINGEITGYAKGITNEGVLLLEDEQKQIHEIYSADIEMSSQL